MAIVGHVSSHMMGTSPCPCGKGMLHMKSHRFPQAAWLACVSFLNEHVSGMSTLMSSDVEVPLQQGDNDASTIVVEC